MSFKAAAAGLDLGGGKAVIIGDYHTDKTERLLRAYGRIVDSLRGRYITAEDVGTTAADMEMIRRETQWAVGIPIPEGGSGDPSPATARGLFSGLTAVSEFLWNTDDLGGRRVAIQGVGKVGYYFVQLLTEAGCEVIVADVYGPAAQRVQEEFGAKVVEPDEILFVDCDVLSPCALGASLNHETIPKLQCQVVAGAANNQLLTDEDGNRLAERDILYAPDFVVNAGGLINVFEEMRGYEKNRAMHHVDSIHDATMRILEKSQRDGINPHAAAVAVAEERMRMIGDLRRFRRHGEDRN
jgi:leucine dehydrogenase